MSFLSQIITKPWEHAGEMDGLQGTLDNGYSASRTGLLLFLAVISSMFLLFIITYYTRSKFPDWDVLADPAILWVNTAVLVLASVALQMASNAAKQNKTGIMRNSLIAGGVLTLAFIAGQLIAWDQMVTAGYYAQGALGFRMNQTGKGEKVLQSVRLCATYWHYLLIVWLVLFTLLLRT